MKKIILSLIIVTVSVMTVLSQKEIKTNQNTKDIPEIYFENTTHNFGEIKYDGNGTCEFTFKNTGKEPLLLTNVKAACGCTTPTWPKSPIKNGKKGTIVVKYNTKIIGSFTKSIRVYSNAKTSPVTLKVTGTVTKPETASTN